MQRDDNIMSCFSQGIMKYTHNRSKKTKNKNKNKKSAKYPPPLLPSREINAVKLSQLTLRVIKKSTVQSFIR